MNSTQTNYRVERSVPGLHDSLIRHLPAHLRKENAVLDLGCGTGAWLERLSNAGFTNLYGVDFSPDDSAGVNARISQANLDDRDWSDGMKAFSLITAIEVLEHLENPGSFLHQLARLLDSNGRILITTPNVHSLICRVRYLMNGKLKQFDDKGDPTHIYPVFIQNLERVLERKGLKIESYWGYPEDGTSLTSRAPLRMLGRALGLFLPEKIGGDVFCMLIAKAN